jgi:hypothetical protein
VRYLEDYAAGHTFVGSGLLRIDSERIKTLQASPLHSPCILMRSSAVPQAAIRGVGGKRAPRAKDVQLRLASISEIDVFRALKKTLGIANSFPKGGVEQRSQLGERLPAQ